MFILCFACLLPVAAAPHHSRANFLDEVIVLDGEIIRFRWSNPHALIYVSVRSSDGKRVEWEVETTATPTLVRSGWTAASLKQGERVQVRARPDRDRTRRFVDLVSIQKGDGTVLSIRRARDVTDPGVQPKATSIFGVWRPAAASEGGVVRQGGQGIAPGAADQPPLGLPLTARGREAAQRFRIADNPRNHCVPPTSPETLANPYLHAIEQRGQDIVLRDEYMQIERTVHMDGLPSPGSRSRHGYSTGRWEGAALVVETTHYADQPWGVARGIPSGEKKRVIERYRLADGGSTLLVEFSIEDPDYLAEPFRDTVKWRFAPQLQLVPNTCEVDVARRYLGTP
jgi:hypothetical protein